VKNASSPIPAPSDRRLKNYAAYFNHCARFKSKAQ
jgi:hypothetical protein